MSCEKCNEAQDAAAVYPHRWKSATVTLVACIEHAKEIINALNDAQLERDRTARKHIGRENGTGGCSSDFCWCHE